MVLKSHDVKSFFYFLFFLSLGGTYAFGFQSSPRIFNYLTIFFSAFICFLVDFRNLRFRLKLSYVFPLYAFALFFCASLSLYGGGYLKLITLLMVIIIASFTAMDHTLTSFSKLLYKYGKYLIGFVLLGSFFLDGSFYSDFSRGEGLSAFYAQKNSLGRYLAFFWLLVCFLFTKTRNKIFLLFWFSLLLYLILETESRSSLLMFLLICFFLFAFTFSRRWLLLVFALIVFITVIFYFMVDYISPDGDYFSVAGIAVSSTGRLAIWEYLFERTKDEALYFGFGLAGVYEYGGKFGAFDELGWTLTDAHNGFLDLFVQLGVTGLVLILFLYIYISVYILRYLKGINKFFGFNVIVFVWMLNILSSHFLESLTFLNFCIFFVYYSAFLKRRGDLC